MPVTYEQITEYIIENQERFYRLAYSYLRDREETLDAVQNAVCKALEKYKTLREVGAMKTWFYRILVNESLDALRSKKKIIYLEPEDMPEEGYEDKLPSEGEDLARRVEELPGDLQTVIKLRFYEDMSLQEISEVTECNLNTVKTRLYRALKRLRIAVESEEADERI